MQEERLFAKPRAALVHLLSQIRRMISRLVVPSFSLHIYYPKEVKMKPPILRQSSRKLLAQLLDEPDLDAQLMGLTGAEWKAVVSVVGLEDSGELLALASSQQLLELFDEELWTSGVASGENIDAERFATLLEVLQDSGIEELAKKLSTLSEDFLQLAMGSLVTVWSSEFLTRYAEDGQVEKKLESCLIEEFGEYLILSSGGLGWDVVIELLATWNESDPALIDRLFSRLAAVSESEIQGPDDLLTVLDGMDELREEAEAEREERRAALGYVSSSDARAFLALPPLGIPSELDAISKAYFRRLEPRQTSASQGALRGRSLSQLIKSQRSDRTALREPDGLFKLAMRQLQIRQPEIHARCVEELAFLVNVLAADLRAHDMATNPAKSLREVTKRLEVASIGTVSSISDKSIEKIAVSLIEWGPIGLYRKARD